MRAKRIFGASMLLLALALVQGGDTSPPAVRMGAADAVEQAAPTLAELQFTTPEYQREAVGLLIGEANRVAAALELSERLPINMDGVKEVFIAPPRMAQIVGLGNITTANYTYIVAVGQKFSSLVKVDLLTSYQRLANHYRWPISRMDTNAAFMLATNIMQAASMDVQGLRRDCAIRIDAYRPEGRRSKHYVPLYWVRWLWLNCFCQPGQ